MGTISPRGSPALDVVYPVIFVDAIVVKVRDGQVRNTPYLSRDGRHDEWGTRHPGYLGRRRYRKGARFWLQVVTELKNRGVEDVLITVCDGLKGATGGDQHHLGAGGRAAVHRLPHPQLVLLRRPAALRCDREIAAPGSTPPRPSTQPRKSSLPSRTSGIQRSCTCDALLGRSSFPSWNTTSKSVG